MEKTFLYRLNFVKLENNEHESVYCTGTNVENVLATASAQFVGWHVNNLELVALEGKNETYPSLLLATSQSVVG